MFTIPINMIIDRAVEKVDDLNRKYEILGIASINGKISVVAAVLVFLTGGMLMEGFNYSWAPESGNYWLVAKQTIWLILLVGSLIFLKPQNDKMHRLIDEGADSEKIFDAYRTLKIRGHMLTSFILINIFLVTTKPF